MILYLCTFDSRVTKVNLKQTVTVKVLLKTYRSLRLYLAKMRIERINIFEFRHGWP